MRIRNITVACLIIILTFTSLWGCRKKGDISIYKKAIDNTKNIKQAEESSSFNITMDLQGSNLTPQQKRKLEPYGNLQGSSRMKYDKDKNLLYLQMTVNANTVPVNMEVFGDADRLIVLLPMLTKYMIIDDTDTRYKSIQDAIQTIMSVRSRQLDILSEKVSGDKVKLLSSQQIDTPEGKAQVSSYSINLDSTVTAQIYSIGFNALLDDPRIKGTLVDISGASGLSNAAASKKYDDFAAGFKGVIQRIGVDDSTYNIYIDQTPYIRGNSISYDLRYTDKSGRVLKLKLNSQMKRWNIGKPVEIKMPEVNTSNSFLSQNLKDNLPDFYKAYFNQVLTPAP